MEQARGGKQLLSDIMTRYRGGWYNEILENSYYSSVVTAVIGWCPPLKIMSSYYFDVVSAVFGRNFFLKSTRVCVFKNPDKIKKFNFL